MHMYRYVENVFMCMCVCVCVVERERELEKEEDRCIQLTEKERSTSSALLCGSKK